MRLTFLAAVSLSLSSSPAALAAGAEAAAFGARQTVHQVSLSPDGKRVAVVMPVDTRGTAAVVIELTGDQKKTVVLKFDGKPDRIQSCSWVLDTRLVCDIFGVLVDGVDLVGSSRLMVVSADGSNLKMLSAPASGMAQYRLFNGGDIVDLNASGDANSLLMTRVVIPDQQAGTLLGERGEGLAVEQVNVNTLARKQILRPSDNAFSYLSDGLGNIRIMSAARKTDSGYDKNSNSYFYRLPGETRWDPLSTEIIADGGLTIGFAPIAIDPKLNIAYGLEGRNGRTVLASIALDGSMKHDLVFDQGSVDVDDVLTIGRQRRVIGVTFATETRQAAIFDPAIKRLADALRKALPNSPEIDIVDASADESVLLIWASSDVDPGRYYLYDKRAGHLGELIEVRPQLAGRTLAKVQAITISAGDGAQIPGYLTIPPGSDGKNLPLVVMPHGGPSARDEWGFDWLPQFFAARGYAVLQPNFRGSTGYGSAWFEKNGFQSWRTAIGDVNAAAHWALAQGIAAPGKTAIVGWSYGGYAALQSAVTEPGLFKAVVAVAPVTDLDDWRREAERFSHFRRRDNFIGRGPHVEEGSPARHAGAIDVPVLLFHGDRDRNVRIAESRLMRDRLSSAGKQVQLVEFEGLDHNLPDDAARTELLDRTDNFLRTVLKLP